MCGLRLLTAIATSGSTAGASTIVLAISDSRGATWRAVEITWSSWTLLYSASSQSWESGEVLTACLIGRHGSWLSKCSRLVLPRADGRASPRSMPSFLFSSWKFFFVHSCRCRWCLMCGFHASIVDGSSAFHVQHNIT